MLRRHRYLTLALFACAVLGGCAVAPGGQPTAAIAPPQLETALRNGDLAAVQTIAADNARPGPEAALARAALDYWWGLDERAAAPLVQAAGEATLSEDLRRSASIMLSGLRFRQGRFGEVVAALDAALPAETDAAVRADLEQTRAFAAALVGVPAMQALVPSSAVVPLAQDGVSLMRAPVTIGSGTLNAIVDTGSAVSTISESNARRLGLQRLTGKVGVGTATSASVTTSLAIADSVVFGGARFRNVIFIVLPDSALTFSDGAYVVEAIIGLPVLRRLGRLEFDQNGDTGTLRYSRTPGFPGRESNLMLAAEQVFVAAPVEGAGRPIRLFIDNGAVHSHLNRRFVAEFPDLAATASHESVTTTGGAGSETQDDALRLPSLTLRLGETPAALADIAVTDDHQTDRHGSIGLDALRSGRGYVLDFDAMQLKILPRP